MMSISRGQEANRGRSKLKMYLLKSKVCCSFLEIKIVLHGTAFRRGGSSKTFHRLVRLVWSNVCVFSI